MATTTQPLNLEQITQYLLNAHEAWIVTTEEPAAEKAERKLFKSCWRAIAVSARLISDDDDADRAWILYCTAHEMLAELSK